MIILSFINQLEENIQLVVAPESFSNSKKPTPPLHLILISSMILIDMFHIIRIVFTSSFNWTSIYFYLLFAIDIPIIYGLWNIRNWARYLIIFTALSRIIVEGFLLIAYFQTNTLGYIALDIAIPLLMLIYFIRTPIKLLFKS